MEKKQFLPVKIAHLLIMVAGVVLYIISLASVSGGSSPLHTISTILNIVALLSGIFYLGLGYKKNAALYYKVFMWILVIAEIVEYVSIYRVSGVQVSALKTFVKFISFTLFILLAGAKDYGVVKSNIISLSLVALSIFTVIDVFVSAVPTFEAAGLPTKSLIIGAINQLIIASTAALMVCGKYIDKAARGRD